MELIVGCVTRMPDGYDDRYFNVEVIGDRLTDGCEINLHYLMEDIQPMVAEIVDEIVYLIEAYSGDLLWAKQEEAENILEEIVNIKDNTIDV